MVLCVSIRDVTLSCNPNRVIRIMLEPEDADNIEKLLNGGIRKFEICEKFDCEPHVLRSFMRKHGIESPDERKNPSEARIKQLQDVAARRVATYRGLYQSENVKTILRLGAAGESPRDIAAAIGRKESFVKHILVLYNIIKCEKLEEAKVWVANAGTVSGMMKQYGLSKSKATHWYKKVKQSKS